jgi:F-type H+-transporting ATPase subunit b
MLSFSVSFFITIVNFYVLYWIIRKWLWKPVRAMLEKRSEMVKTDLSEAAQAKGKAEALRNHYEVLLSAAKTEVNTIRQEAVQQATTEAKAVVGSARHEAESLRTRAHDDSAKAREAALESLTADIARIAAKAAAMLAGRESTAADAVAADALIRELRGRDGR